MTVSLGHLGKTTQIGRAVGLAEVFLPGRTVVEQRQASMLGAVVQTVNKQELRLCDEVIHVQLKLVEEITTAVRVTEVHHPVDDVVQLTKSDGVLHRGRREDADHVASVLLGQFLGSDAVQVRVLVDDEPLQYQRPFLVESLLLRARFHPGVPGRFLGRGIHPLVVQYHGQYLGDTDQQQAVARVVKHRVMPAAQGLINTINGLLVRFGQE